MTSNAAPRPPAISPMAEDESFDDVAESLVVTSGSVAEGDVEERIFDEDIAVGGVSSVIVGCAAMLRVPDDGIISKELVDTWEVLELV